MSVHSTSSFGDAYILAVNLGNDANTVGAITGQLAGALYGASAIPQRQLKPRKASSFMWAAAFAPVSEPVPRMSWRSRAL